MAQTTTQNIGGWAPSALPGSNVNKFGFTPAPRTPNMIWQGSLGPDSLWPSGFTSADLAFKGNVAAGAEYTTMRLVDISDPKNPRTLSTINLSGSQGDVVLFDNILVRGHETACTTSRTAT